MRLGHIENGIVSDHITEGNSMNIYNVLKLKDLDCAVALIQKVDSVKMGKKDIIKIECPIDIIDMNVLGFIDHTITVNIVKDSEIVEKKTLELPKEVVNVVKCRNPPKCDRSIRPIQCRTFPLVPHIDENGEFHRSCYGRNGDCSPCKRRRFCP